MQLITVPISGPDVWLYDIHQSRQSLEKYTIKLNLSQ